MNGASELDLELLESYLDDALTSPEIAELEQRLLAEPVLESALAELKQERSMRRPWLDSLVADAGAVDRVMAGVKKSIRREEFRAHRSGAIRYFGAAAACLIAGVLLGMSMRSHVDPGAQTMAKVDTAHTTPSINSQPIAFQVSLVDHEGHVVASQNFDDLQKARDFSDDLNQYQLRQKRVRNSPVVPGADRF